MKTEPLHASQHNRHPKLWLVILVLAVNIIGRAGPGDVDPNFDPGAGFGFTSYGMGVVALGKTAVQPDGKVLISGGYSALRSVFGQPRNRLARLNVDGSLDLGFQQGMGGLDGNVSAFAIQPDGKILIGGNFTKVNGVSRPYLARLNANGSLDPTFLNGLSGPDFEVAALSLQTNGQIVVGGYFTNLNGTLRSRLGRLNADGSVDLSFSAVSFGQNNSVQDVAVQADGKVISGGWITSVNGMARGNLARFNPDGSLDTTFLAGMPGVNSDVSQAIVQPDGRVLIAGRFSSVNGSPQSWIARLEWDGSTDTNFVVNLEGYIFHSGIRIGLQADGKIVMGANFHNTDRTWRNCLGRLNPDGSIDRGFPQLEMRENYDLGVNSLSILADGRMVVAGGFNYRSTSAAGRYLCRVNPDGTLDESFQCQKGVDNPVLVAQAEPDGKVLLAGKFMSIAGSPREGFARLNTDGSLDLGMTNPIVSTIWELVRCVAPQADGKIILGGNFQYTNGLPQRGLMRLNTDGSFDPTFMNGLAGPNGAVWAMAMTTDGKLLVGGQFTLLNGYAVTNLARLNADGSVDATFVRRTNGIPQIITIQGSDGKILLGGNPYGGAALTRLNPDGSLDSGFLGSASDVRSIAVQPNDGKILIGGGFTTVNGAPINYLTRLNTNGSLDTPFAPLVSGNYPAVNSVALQPDGKMILGGDFWTVNGVGRTNLARLYPDGSLDTSFLNGRSGPDGVVNSLVFQDDGKILVGGEFGMVNGVGRGFVAKLELGTIPNPFIQQQPISQTVKVNSNATFTVTAMGSPPPTYQWLFNGTNVLVGETNSQLLLTSVQPLQAGNYSVLVSNKVGFVVSSPARLTVSSPVVFECTEAALRAAMADGGTVTFACDGTVVLSNTIIIATNTVLDASGHQVTISGNNAVRVFYVNSNVNFTLANLAITQGSSTMGGALYNDGGSVSAMGCSLNGNQVQGADSTEAFGSGGSATGGAVYNKGVIRLSDCVVTSNWAQGGRGSSYYQTHSDGTGGGEASGGAIYSSGTLTMLNCLVQGNGAFGGDGGDGPSLPTYGRGGAGGGSRGGAIAGAGGVFVTNCVFGGNSNRGGRAGSSYTSGDGGSAIGGAVQGEAGVFHAHGCRLVMNSATAGSYGSSKGGPSGTAQGGAVSLRNTTATFTSSVLTSNKINGDAAEGGGLRQEGGSLRLVGCNVSNNEVRGMYSMNYYGRVPPPCRGGGVYANAQSEVSDCTIENNELWGSASGGGLNPSAGGIALGGGIYSSNALVLRQSTLNGNRVVGGSGAGASGMGSPPTRGGLAQGGGLATEQGTHRIENCTFAANTATGGWSWGQPPFEPPGTGGDAIGGGIYAAGSNCIQFCTVATNGAFGGSGNTAGTAAASGIYSGGAVTIKNTIVAQNSAGADISGNFTGDHNLIGADPLLAPLGSNGGPTWTMALLPGSPAIDAADSSAAPPTDQRGFARVGPADIGAFEYWPPAAPSILHQPLTQTAELGGTARISITATGYPPPSCQWYLNGTYAVPGGTNAVLELTGLELTHIGEYTMVLSNPFGCLTSAPAMLNVIPPVERRLVPGLHISGQPGGALNVESAESLSQTPSWSALDSVILNNAEVDYFDLTLPLPAQRFYRGWQIGATNLTLTLDLQMVPALTLTGNVSDSICVDGINQFGPTDAWFALGTVTLTNTSQLYFDVTAPGQPTRLYRLVPLP